MERRLAEAARLGFRVAITPRGVERAPSGLRIIEVPDVTTFFTRLGALRAAPEPVVEAC
jgi:DNA repair protein RadA/Sms